MFFFFYLFLRMLCFFSFFPPFVSGVSFGMLDILFEFAARIGVFSEGTPHQDLWGILPCNRFGSHCLTTLHYRSRHAFLHQFASHSP